MPLLANLFIPMTKVIIDSSWTEIIQGDDKCLALEKRKKVSFSCKVSATISGAQLYYAYYHPLIMTISHAAKEMGKWCDAMTGIEGSSGVSCCALLIPYPSASVDVVIFNLIFLSFYSKLNHNSISCFSYLPLLVTYG